MRELTLAYISSLVSHYQGNTYLSGVSNVSQGLILRYESNHCNKVMALVCEDNLTEIFPLSVRLCESLKSAAS